MIVVGAVLDGSVQVDDRLSGTTAISVLVHNKVCADCCSCLVIGAYWWWLLCRADAIRGECGRLEGGDRLRGRRQAQGSNIQHAGPTEPPCAAGFQPLKRPDTLPSGREEQSVGCRGKDLLCSSGEAAVPPTLLCHSRCCLLTQLIRCLASAEQMTGLGMMIGMAQTLLASGA